jgi:hypothetical protein
LSGGIEGVNALGWLAWRYPHGSRASGALFGENALCFADGLLGFLVAN